MSLIRTLSDSEDVHKDTWIEQQEELKIRLWEEVAKDMDYIIAGQKYVDDMTDILNLNKEDVT
jgi:cobalamin biosynthesis Co2+ chelatase CbiK